MPAARNETDNPLFKATEGSGKSKMSDILTKGYNVKDVGRFSQHALDYTNLEGIDILRLKELGSMDQEDQGISTLKFLSCDDKGYTVEVTVRDEKTGKFTTMQNKIPAITVISGTTRIAIDPQFERGAWLFGLDETPEQTARIANWDAKQEMQENQKILGKITLTDREFASEVYKAFIDDFYSVQIIFLFPRTIASVLNFNVLRARGERACEIRLFE